MNHEHELVEQKGYPIDEVYLLCECGQSKHIKNIKVLPLKITNYKEEEEAEKLLKSLEKKRNKLQDEVWGLQTRINELEEALENYMNEQRARDE